MQQEELNISQKNDKSGCGENVQLKKVKQFT